MDHRTPLHFSHEFAGYMATAVEHYWKVLERQQTAKRGMSFEEEALQEELSEARRHLRSAVYEWKKRAAKVK